jgi:hypothetical protein
MLSRTLARQLLEECVGNEIWSESLCHQKGIPDAWIDELIDCFESGFRHDRQTVYYGQRPVNQYRGVHDRDLAVRLASFLGVDAAAIMATCFGPEMEVRALREAVEEA